MSVLVDFEWLPDAAGEAEQLAGIRQCVMSKGQGMPLVPSSIVFCRSVNAGHIIPALTRRSRRVQSI